MTKKNKILLSLVITTLIGLGTTAGLNSNLFKGSTGDTPPSFSLGNWYGSNTDQEETPDQETPPANNDDRTPSATSNTLTFSEPALVAANFTNSTTEESGATIKVKTYNQKVLIDRRNQTDANIVFFSNQAASFKTVIVSKLAEQAAFTSEATVHTPNANGLQEIASTATGALNPVTLKWNKTCTTTVDCSTANQREYYLYFDVTFNSTPVEKVRYIIPLEFQNPVISKIITSCSQTANLGGEITCTGKVPEGITVENLKLKLKDASGNDVASSEKACTTATDKTIKCILTAPATTGTYSIIASATQPAIANEQVGSVTVVDYNKFIKVTTTSPIRSGAASQIVIDLDEATEFISVTARVQGPKGYTKSIYFECHESLTAFTCPNKVATKIKKDKIPITWISTDVVPGVYDVVAFARTDNTSEAVYATAQITVQPGTCSSYFADIQANDPSCEALEYARENGIFLGKIGPNGQRVADLRSNLSRAEFFAIASRLYQRVNNGTNYGMGRLQNFRDLNDRVINDPNNKFWIDAIITLDGIVEGYGDGTLRPQNPLKMAELAKVVGLSTNFIGYYNNNANPWYQDILNQYNDARINFNPEANASRGDTVRLIFDTLQEANRTYFNDTTSSNGYYNNQSEYGFDEFNQVPLFLNDGFNYIDEDQETITLGTLNIPRELLDNY